MVEIRTVDDESPHSSYSSLRNIWTRTIPRLQTLSSEKAKICTFITVGWSVTVEFEKAGIDNE